MVTTREYRRTHPEYREKQKVYARKYRRKHPNYTREWNKKHPNYMRDYMRKKRQKDPEYFCIAQRTTNKQHPGRHNVRAHAQYHCEIGSSCELCGTMENLERHHPDYNYPLLVITVCKECHTWINHKT